MKVTFPTNARRTKDRECSHVRIEFDNGTYFDIFQDTQSGIPNSLSIIKIDCDMHHRITVNPDSGNKVILS